MAEAQATPFSGTTAWARSIPTPLRSFLSTETGSAAVLLAAAVAALLWANIDSSSYASFWSTELSIKVGSHGIEKSLGYWVNSGLMTFFFFVVGLEARREFDIGELRERRRLLLPVVAALAGMLVPIAIFLVANAGHDSAQGWGTAMSTDTAFALGMLALVGPRFPDRLRAFMLTIAVVDDVLALIVIAVAYSDDIVGWALLTAIVLFAAVPIAVRLGLRIGYVHAAFGAAAWVALVKSGVDPIVVGLALGLVTYAYPASREDLERATDLFRDFREQPTPELARTARLGLDSAISANERLQQRFHPVVSYGIVPLFALANAGIAINADFLGRAYTSPITLGILIGYVAGKPIGIIGGSWLVTRLSRGRVLAPTGWAALTGGGFIAGIGFTVSLLIANLAFTGDDLAEAKLGVLSAALVASVATWLVFRATAMLPTPLKIRALLGTSEVIVDLAVPVDPEGDHIRGPEDAPVTLVEYGDFECPYCGMAEPIVRELLADFGDLRYVWRHLPLSDVHPRAQIAAEAAEAAGEQGAFWEMHDLLLTHQDALTPRDLMRYADELGLDTERFRDEVLGHEYTTRVYDDVDGADLSGVSGTPTFFINGRRHYGAYDVATLSAEVRAARARAAIAS